MSERRVRQGQGVDPEVTLVKNIKRVFLLEDDRAQRASGGVGPFQQLPPFREH